VVYEIGRVGDRAAGERSLRRPSSSSGGVEPSEPAGTHEILMQDLAAEMTVPCAMAIIMGTRTATPADFAASGDEVRPDLIERMEKVGEVADEDRRLGGTSLLRYLRFLDEASSSASLGFRIDAAKTVNDGALETLPLPPGTTFSTLRDEADIASALGTFLQGDAMLVRATLTKLEKLVEALQRSSFLSRHVFLRTTLLLIYDDADRETKLELKLMNFGSSYAVPEGQSVTHTAEWDGTVASHEDGFLFGVESLVRILKSMAAELSPSPLTRLRRFSLGLGPGSTKALQGAGAAQNGDGQKALPRPPGRGLMRAN